MARKNVRRQAGHGQLVTAWTAVLAIFIVLLFTSAWCRVQCVRTGYEISRATSRRQELLALQSDLKVELARLKSPQRIERIARQRLGLRPPGPEQMVVVP